MQCATAVHRVCLAPAVVHSPASGVPADRCSSLDVSLDVAPEARSSHVQSAWSWLKLLRKDHAHPHAVSGLLAAVRIQPADLRRLARCLCSTIGQLQGRLHCGTRRISPSGRRLTVLHAALVQC